MTGKEKQQAYFLLNELQKQNAETKKGIVELGFNQRISDYFYQITIHIGKIKDELTKIPVE